MKASLVSRAYVLCTVFNAVIMFGVIGQSDAVETKAADAKSKEAEATDTATKDAKSSARPANGAEATANKPRLINLNTATEAQLSSIPGIGSKYAKKVIAGRPYKSIDDLSKAGVPTTTISKIRSQVSLTDTAVVRTAAKPIIPETTPALIDLNKAAEEELRNVPGLGEKYAKKIVASRPYKSVDDLSKAGVPKTIIAKIKSQLTVGLAAAPEKGMVWVNLISNKYHKEGGQWYGKTKSGEYMTEADAIEAGYRAAKR
jgi:DNA uptake protein ComE-like DNA-binding protein